MLGTEIKSYLEENGLKQKMLAEKSNIPIQTLNAILNEQRKLGAEEYFVLCNSLGVSVDYFATKLGFIEVRRLVKEETQEE